MALPESAAKTDTRCGECGERLHMYQHDDGVSWNVGCEGGCSNIVRTTQTWIYAEFCEPFISRGSTAPIVRVKK